MKTMPRTTLRLMRWILLALYRLVSRWEDKNADVRDYRMGHLTAGLWQAAESIRQILDGEYNPLLAEAAMGALHDSGTVGPPERWDGGQKLSRTYVDELFADTRIPLTPVD